MGIFIKEEQREKGGSKIKMADLLFVKVYQFSMNLIPCKVVGVPQMTLQRLCDVSAVPVMLAINLSFPSNIVLHFSFCLILILFSVHCFFLRRCC